MGQVSKFVFRTHQRVRARATHTGLPGVASASAILAVLVRRRGRDGLGALVRALNALVGGAVEALVQALVALPGEAVAGAVLALLVAICDLCEGAGLVRTCESE